MMRSIQPFSILRLIRGYWEEDPGYSHQSFILKTSFYYSSVDIRLRHVWNTGFKIIKLSELDQWFKSLFSRSFLYFHDVCSAAVKNWKIFFVVWLKTSLDFDFWLRIRLGFWNWTFDLDFGIGLCTRTWTWIVKTVCLVHAW